MSSRFMGVIAIGIGAATIGITMASDGSLAVKPLIGGMAFLVVGLYYTISGKTAASIKDFVVHGKLTKEKRE